MAVNVNNGSFYDESPHEEKLSAPEPLPDDKNNFLEVPTLRNIAMLVPHDEDVEPYGLLREDSSLFRNNLKIAEAFINRSYMSVLSGAEVVAVDETTKASQNNIRLFPVAKFVYDAEEDINDKLMNVYSAMHQDGSSIVLILHGTEKAVNFYLGSKNMVKTASEGLLSASFLGNFPGSSLQEGLDYDSIEGLMKELTTSGNKLNVACVTAVPSPRTDGQANKYQYLDQFIDTMRGKKYVAMLMATPVSDAMLEERIDGFARLSSELSPYAQQNLSHQISENETINTGRSSTFSRNISTAVAKSTGTSTSNGTTHSNTSSKTNSRTEGGSSNLQWNGGVSIGNSSQHSVGTAEGNAYTVSVTENTGTTEQTTDTSSEGETWSEQEASGTARGTGTSRTVSVSRSNKKVQLMMEQVEQQISRLKESKAFGVWECAAYFISEEKVNAGHAANAFRALLLGDKSTSEQSYVTEWNGNQGNTQTDGVLEHLRLVSHPRFQVAMEGADVRFRQQVQPGCLLSGKELPLFLGMPRVSVNGLPVLQMASFERNITKIDLPKPGRTPREFPVGKIFHRGMVEPHSEVLLDADNLTAHTFVTGSTGSGKSNTTYRLLESLYDRHKIPFLVIEPAKGEYKSQFAALPGINIFTTQEAVNRLLRINPFEFPEGIQLLEHLDRLLEIFKACWEMTAAMPALLKKSLEAIYCKAGWDLTSSVNVLSPDKPVYPTFRDLLETMREVIESSDYSAEVKGNYKGSLVSRVESLTNGIVGQVFCSGVSNRDTELFDEPTIVDLSRIGAAETKALIMGVLVMRLNEHRVVHLKENNSPLRHLTVLEEAHNLLPRIATGSAGSELQAKSVEMLSNSIAEMRSCGEGFLIVDQSPSAVSEAAIRNTNTKIIMRLPDAEDARTAGLSIGLNENQILEISKFPQGVAAVKQSSWMSAVLVKIDAAENRYRGEVQTVSGAAWRAVRTALWQYIAAAVAENRYREEEMQSLIAASALTPDKKKDISMLLPPIQEAYTEERQGMAEAADRLVAAVIRLLGLENLLGVFEPHLAAMNSMLPAPRPDFLTALKEMSPEKHRALSLRREEWHGKLVSALSAYLHSDALAEKERTMLVKWLMRHRYCVLRGTPISRWYICFNVLPGL